MSTCQGCPHTARVEHRIPRPCARLLPTGVRGRCRGLAEGCPARQRPRARVHRRHAHAATRGGTAPQSALHAWSEAGREAPGDGRHRRAHALGGGVDVADRPPARVQWPVLQHPGRLNVCPCARCLCALGRPPARGAAKEAHRPGGLRKRLSRHRPPAPPRQRHHASPNSPLPPVRRLCPRQARARTELWLVAEAGRPPGRRTGYCAASRPQTSAEPVGRAPVGRARRLRGEGAGRVGSSRGNGQRRACGPALCSRASVSACFRARRIIGRSRRETGRVKSWGSKTPLFRGSELIVHAVSLVARTGFPLGGCPFGCLTQRRWVQATTGGRATTPPWPRSRPRPPRPPAPPSSSSCAPPGRACARPAPR